MIVIFSGFLHTLDRFSIHNLPLPHGRWLNVELRYRKILKRFKLGHIEKLNTCFDNDVYLITMLITFSHSMLVCSDNRVAIYHFSNPGSKHLPYPVNSNCNEISDA